MSVDRDIESADQVATPCSEYDKLAVISKFAVGLTCPLDEQEPSAYVHGTLEVKDRAGVGELGFIINSKTQAYPVLDGNNKTDSQLDLTGALRVTGLPAGSSHGAVGRFIIDGQSETTGSDVVPLQVWRDSKGSSLSVVDAAGHLGLGTLQPEVSLDVAGNAHVDGGLAIGADTYSNSLTIQSTFSQRATGTFSGQANVPTIVGDASQFRIGDVFKILVGSQFILNVQQSELFTVSTISNDLMSFTVVVNPETNFPTGVIYVDQPSISIRSGTGLPLVEVNRFGDVDIAGNATIGGVLNGDEIVRQAQIANNAVTQAKLSAASVGTSQIIDASVTSSKLASNSVGTGQIADDSVTTAKIVGVSVTTDKIADRSVTPGKMSVSMISGIVDPQGNVYSGVGFTVAKVALGFYNVTFTPPLSAVLGGSATQIYVWPMSKTGQAGKTTDNAVIVYLGTDLLRVKTGNGDGNPEDRAFTFVVIAK